MIRIGRIGQMRLHAHLGDLQGSACSVYAPEDEAEPGLIGLVAKVFGSDCAGDGLARRIAFHLRGALQIDGRAHLCSMQSPPVKGVAALYPEVELVVPVKSEQPRREQAVVTAPLPRGVSGTAQIRAGRCARGSNRRRGAVKARLGSADVGRGRQCLIDQGIERGIRIHLPPHGLWPLARGRRRLSGTRAPDRRAELQIRMRFARWPRQARGEGQH